MQPVYPTHIWFKNIFHDLIVTNLAIKDFFWKKQHSPNQAVHY